MVVSTIDQLVTAADLPHESPTEKYRELLNLAEANGDDVLAVQEYFCQFQGPQRVRYVQWFRADELLSHFRTWKDRSTQQDEFWIRVMQSRAHADQLKIWLLGSDRIGLSAYFDELLGQKTINIEEQYGTVAAEEKFSVLTTHVEKRVVLQEFGTGRSDLRIAMENLSGYLRQGLRTFFASNGCTGSNCITAFPADQVNSRQWLNRKLLEKDSRGTRARGNATWSRVFDITEPSGEPQRKRLKETWLLCLRFRFPRVISSGSTLFDSGGRMPNKPSNHGADMRGSRVRHERKVHQDPLSVQDALEDIRNKLRIAVEKSGFTYSQIGERMGYKPEVARAAIARLLSASAKRDPSLSSLIKLAKALGHSLQTLLS